MKCFRLPFLIAWTFLSIACHAPPAAVTMDRFEYAEALAESWKRQTLMNVVHLRYADAPVFLDVSSVINTYTRAGTVSASASVNVPSPATGSAGAGAASTWSNSPTVTYQPVTGDKFAKQLLHPIPPLSVFQMMQAGWPASLIFGVIVRTVNGLRNQSYGQPAEPEFVRLVQNLEKLQKSDAIGFRVHPTKGGEAAVAVISREHVADVQEEAATVRTLLGMEPGLREFDVVFGSVPQNRREVAMVTRSMIEIMLELGSGIDVPPPHLEEKRVITFPAKGGAGPFEPLIHIHSGKAAPADAYAAINYRDYAFWIDDRDVRSKRLFTFLMILFSLAETGQPSAAPLVTISK